MFIVNASYVSLLQANMARCSLFYVSMVHDTTGTAGFPECPLHSGKAQLHSGKPSPSATLGEEPPANPLTEKSPSPSVKNRALGEGFAECRVGTRGRFHAFGRRPTPFSFSFFFLFSSPSATLGKDF